MYISRTNFDAMPGCFNVESKSNRWQMNIFIVKGLENAMKNTFVLIDRFEKYLVQIKGRFDIY